MNPLQILAGSSGSGAGPKTYVDDVFATHLYAGNNGVQSINNGIDLSGKGGLIWTKARNSGGSNVFVDTGRGFNKPIYSDSSNAESTSGSGGDITAFTSTGYTLGPHSTASVNYTWDYVSWTFRKAAKFFDIVTYTGNGSARTITHNLGQTPGMIIIKNLTTGYPWAVYHRSMTGAAYWLSLNGTDAEINNSTVWNGTAPTSSVFSVGSAVVNNEAGSNFVAYIFAHDTSADGLIQCGLITASGTTQSINLGWEPQFLLFKAKNASRPWYIIDMARGWSHDKDTVLFANSSGTEASYTNSYGPFVPTATGFQINSDGWDGAGIDYVYMAIRRPNKPPTSGTQVYNAISANAANGTSRNIGFVSDLVISSCQRTISDYVLFQDRLRGLCGTSVTSIPTLVSLSDTAQSLIPGTTYDSQGDGTVKDGGYLGTYSSIWWHFKRAPGVFDIVCPISTAGVATYYPHNLGVAPELIISRQTHQASNWAVNVPSLGVSSRLFLNFDYAISTQTSSFPGAHSATQIYLGTALTGGLGPMLTYLFATKAGISKVGTYTGNGSNQTIDCGFAAGARFLLIKRTDSAGDWFVYDTIRGIVAGNDPHISLNTTAAEVTSDDSVDPASSGFIVNQVAATNINVNAATYLYLAIA